jgi:hypothetical protein
MLSSFNYQMDVHCTNAEQNEAAKLCQRLWAILHSSCNRMPGLCARLIGEYPTIEQALEKAKRISDESFLEMSEEERARVRRDCLYSSLGQQN